jgi:isopentenyl-diphosphate delta-isomerase
MEYVIVVDSENHIIGVEEKLLAHEKGSLHRAVSVCLFDENDRWLLQKRACVKYHSPNKWANSCCSHPRLNESPIVAAQRRVFEELGIKVSLAPCCSFLYREEVGSGLIEHEFDFLFVGKVLSTFSPHLNQQEVSEIAFFSKSEIEKLMEEKKDFFAPWFKHVFNRF